ncbi:hypothetical protein [Phenylobacterium aquaticum]|uniref:hypothetical protein n=1 Tax=Phenylobacterium aquaticum TaxID=1763816 RepID=UPI001F5D1C01|nr:hypothetical protein [Phenylobacterium aquaticum]MCI3135392.1 hypothetical protein [Phenylobacterium aquaticum]
MNAQRRIDPIANDTGSLDKASAQARRIGGLSADYVLRAIAELASMFDGDILMGVIFLALFRASVEHVGPSLRNIVAGEDGVVPDHARRPITTLALANSLNMPRETVRRYVNRLVELGFCARDSERRLIVTEAMARRPEIGALFSANRRHLERVLSALRREDML